MSGAERVYDGEIKGEVDRVMKSNLSSSTKQEISRAYWCIGHELADGRDDNVIGWGLRLGSLAKGYGLIGLEQSAGDFVRLYESEIPEREKKRSKEAEREREMWRPRKTMAEELAKLSPNGNFPGQQPICFNALYGELTIPDSQYVFIHGYSDSKKRPYIIGKDKRTAGQIWSVLEKRMGNRINEMLEKEIVGHDVNALTDYVGPLENIHMLIGKELIVPRKITERRLRR